MTDTTTRARDQIQTLDTGVILALLESPDILKQELASRGVDKTGQWIGFKAAAQVWKELA